MAAINGNDGCVDSLVKRGANVNAQSVSAGPRASDAPHHPPALSACCLPPRPSQNSKRTPLMFAAYNGYPSTVQKLLAAGADATLKDTVRAAAAEARKGGGGGKAAGLGAWGGARP